MIRHFISIALLALAMVACSSAANNAANAEAEATPQSTNDMQSDTTSVKVEVSTTEGNFTLLLYGDTPKHRDNFVKLVNENFYDSLLFHRIIDQFMVQAGDPDSRNAAPGQMLGGGDPGYTLPAEIVYPKHFHKRGALAAARQGDQVNPERRSSGSQFYVVTGRKVSEDELRSMQVRMAFQELAMDNRDKIQEMQRNQDREGLMALQQKLQEEAIAKAQSGQSPITEEMIQAYTTVGGAPHLDGQYTVFGEVISGMDTIEKIEKARTGAADRPVNDIRILSMKVVE